MSNVKIESDGTPWGTHVYANGEEVEGVTKIEIEPVTPDCIIKGTITVELCEFHMDIEEAKFLKIGTETIPADYVLVPIAPTEKMILAAQCSTQSGVSETSRDSWLKRYAALIDAAPNVAITPITHLKTE